MPASCSRHAHDAEFFAEPLILLVLEEGHLALVVLLPVKEAVTLQSLSGHAFDFGHLDLRRRARRLAVMTEKVVLG